jgi:arabinogalactan endo-1,4-beta-galactosidase
MKDFIKGMDISTWLELEKLGAKFYNDGKEDDLLKILKSYGVNAIRLRLWNDPYTDKGIPYGAGTNDLATTIELTRRTKAAGMDVLLDFHYSDFWADPGKQYIPKAWHGYSATGLTGAIRSFTTQTLEALKKADAFPTMVQIGNEVSNGLLFPYGKRPDYENIVHFINAGISAARKVAPDLPVMIHLADGNNNALYREWFDNYFAKGGEDFEVIGFSYYPFWHGTIQELTDNMHDIAQRYGKDLILAEVSTGFTMEDYREYEGLLPEERKGYATKRELAEKVEFPLTPQGQADFMQEIMARVAGVPGRKGRGFYYWEPAWLPVKGSGWATPGALEYIHDPGPCGNEWANQALFDYNGNALPALATIRDFGFA